MATIFSKFLNFFKSKETRITNVDPESIKQNNIIEAQQKKIAELTARENKRKINEAKQKKREKDKESEEEIKKDLTIQQENIDSEPPQFLSFKKLFHNLRYNKNFSKKAGFYSHNRLKKLASVGDIGVNLINHNLILLDDKGEVVLQAPTPEALFFEPSALVSDLESGKIPLPITPDGKYIENIMDSWKPDVIIPLPNGKYKYSRASKKYLYDLLAGKDSEIGELQSELEQRDQALVSQTNEINSLKMAVKVNENSAEVARKELKLAQGQTSNIERAFRGIANELAQVRDTNVVLDANLESLEGAIDEMRKKAEREGVKLSDERAIESIKNIRRELIRDEPSKEVRIIEKRGQITTDSVKN